MEWLVGDKEDRQAQGVDCGGQVGFVEGIVGGQVGPHGQIEEAWGSYMKEWGLSRVYGGVGGILVGSS